LLMMASAWGSCNEMNPGNGTETQVRPGRSLPPYLAACSEMNPGNGTETFQLRSRSRWICCLQRNESRQRV
jgi:hypothetical protein